VHRLILASIILFAASAFGAQPKTPAPPPPPATPEEIAAMAGATARVQLAPPAHLVFVGDSLTALLPNVNYVALIREALQGRYGPEVKVTNAGVNGDSITRVRARLARDVLALSPKPSHVFLFLGHNDSKLSSVSGYKDAFVSPEAYEKDYRDVITTIQRSLGARVTVLSATSSVYELTQAIADGRAKAGAAHNLFGQPASLERFNAIAWKVAGELGAEYLDLYGPTRRHAEKPSLFMKDGVHVNERGNRVLAIEILKYLGGSGEKATDATWQTPPGWTQTRGGAGGKVVRVTTLAASGPGSLAEALAADGPRRIEFAVGGVLDLGGRSLRVAKPNVTIAGETAPSPGITLTNGGVGITTHDVIVRHLRIRPGAGTRARKSGWEVDGLATGGGARDVIVDHCSFSWATDENLSASGPRFEGATPDDWRRNTSHRVTFSHNLIAEGLNESTHAKGSHSKGSLIHDNASDILIYANLYLSNDDRNPFFKGGARGAVVNNFIHNPGRRVMQFALNLGEWGKYPAQRGTMAIVGNVARRGPSTAKEIAFLEAFGPLDVHLRDNRFFDGAGAALPVTVLRRDREKGLIPHAADSEVQVVPTPPSWPEGLQARPAEETVAWVLANAGARPWDRDAVDRRLLEEARTGGGKIIDFESEVGGLVRP